MGNVPQAARVYREAVSERSLVYAYGGPTMGEVAALKAEAEAASVYIYALEEADAIRKNAEADDTAVRTHKHRAQGPAV